MAKWWDGSPPPRDVRRTDPEHPPKPPGRKDRAKWCRGKVGVEHDYVITIPANTWGWECREWTSCLPSGWKHRHYACYHRWVCTRCGKHHQNRTVTENECKAFLAREKANS